MSSMVGVERRLISAIVRDGVKGMAEALRMGVESTWFTQPDMRRLWEALHQVYMRRREVLSEEELKNVDGVFRVLPVHAPIGAYVQQLREKKLGVTLLENLGELHNRALIEPTAVYTDLVRFVGELQGLSATSEGVDLVAAGSDYVRSVYEEAQQSKIVKFPWPTVQSETGGLSRGQLVVLFGRPKSMKTFVALWLVVYNVLVERLRVLVISREMNAQELALRLYAMIARVDYGRFKRRQLGDEEVAAVLDEVGQRLELLRTSSSALRPDLPPALEIVDGSQLAGKGFPYVASLIERHKPDLVLDDSIYLAEQEGEGKDGFDWRAQNWVARTAKSYAQRYGIVYLATTQARRRQAGKRDKRAAALDPILELQDLDTVAFSDGYAQNCDLLIRVLNQRNRYLILGFPAYREGILDQVFLEAKPCVSFDEFSLSELSRYETDPSVFAYFSGTSALTSPEDNRSALYTSAVVVRREENREEEKNG